MNIGKQTQGPDMALPGQVEHWLEELRRTSDLTVAPIHFADCEHWSFSGGALRQDQGRFFSIIGVRALTEIAHLANVQQPIIHQPEIGVLGFAVRKTRRGWEWLLQAKTEPGNTHGVQVGPSVQATVSNYMRIHGGLPTPMIELFVGELSAGIQRLTDIEQSEQGDRFLGKYNRNCVVIVPTDYAAPDSKNWSWFSAAALRQALQCDFAINTDARSVMFCSDWRLLTEESRAPFDRWRGTGGFAEALLDSFECPAPRHSLPELLDFLKQQRQATPLIVEQLPLAELSPWRVGDEVIAAQDETSLFSVRAYAVRSSDREIAAWHQPLLVGKRTVAVTMICARLAGTLHFLLRASAEIGFREIVQLGPSHSDDPAHSSIAWAAEALADGDSTVHASVLQSDEGGRFMNSVARYAIVQVPEKWSNVGDPAAVWLTLGQLHSLALRRGVLTNETRSALSILLSWI